MPDWRDGLSEFQIKSLEKKAAQINVLLADKEQHAKEILLTIAELSYPERREFFAKMPRTERKMMLNELLDIIQGKH